MFESIPDLEGSIMFWVKIGLIVFMLIYSVFSLVVIRQVNHMTDTLEVGFEPTLRFIAKAHFVVAIAVLLVAIVIL